MTKRFLLLMCLFLLTTPWASAEEIRPGLTDELRSPVPMDRQGQPVRALSGAPWVSLSLEEEYGTEAADSLGHPPVPSSRPGTQRPKTLLFLVGCALFLFLFDRYLKYRITAALPSIPWEGVREDPSVQQWPSRSLWGKLRILSYLKALPHLEKAAQNRENLETLPQRNPRDRRLALHSAARLKRVRCPGEIRFLLAVLRVIGDARAVEPILQLLKRFPENEVLTEEGTAALVHIRDAKVIPALLPFVAGAEGPFLNILVRVCRSFGEAGRHLLARELRRPETRVRTGILRILGEIGGPEAIPVLERFLVRGRQEEQIAAVGALSRLGDAACMDVLIQALCQNPSPAVRTEIARGLAHLPREAVLERLTRIAGASPTHYFRIRAIQGIEALEPEDCTPLLSALEDPHVKVRSAAAAALQRLGVIGQRLENYLEHFDEATQEFLVGVGRTGLLEPFLSALRSRESKHLKRAIRLAARIGSRAFRSPLKELLAATEDWTVKSRLIPALAALQATECVPDIIGHLQDKHHWVRKTSIEALGRLVAPDSSLRARTLPALHKALQEAHPWSRASAIRVLVSLEDPSCAPRLLELLRDPQTRVRVEAVRGLKHFRTPEAEPHLMDLLEDPRQKVAAMAASALGELRSRKALGPLFHAFPGAKPLFRLAILEAVQQIDATELDPLLRHLRRADRYNIQVVRRLRDLAFADPAPMLMSLARNGELEIRCAALRGLLGLAGPEIEAFALTMLDDPEPSVRAAAVDALALSQAPETAARLAAMLDDPDLAVRLRAILVLGLVKNPEFLPFLRNCLYEEDPLLRAHAILALFHYAEPRFLELFLEQFRELRVRNTMRKMLSDRKDPLVPLLVERVPPYRQHELRILRDHTLKSLDAELEEQILYGGTKQEKLKAVMIAEILKRKKLKRALKKAIHSDPHAEVRARALRAYSEMAEMRRERELIRKAIQDPSLEVQTAASRLVIHLEEETV